MVDWQASGPADGQEYADIRYETAEGIAKITINRPEVRNAFRPTTLFELQNAFSVARLLAAGCLSPWVVTVSG